MPAGKEPRGKIGENDDTEHDVERFRDVVRRQERRGDDEQDGYDIEYQQPIAKADALRRRALIQVASAPSDRGERHGDIFTARARHCKWWLAATMKVKVKVPAACPEITSCSPPHARRRRPR